MTLKLLTFRVFFASWNGPNKYTESGKKYTESGKKDTESGKSVEGNEPYSTSTRVASGSLARPAPCEIWEARGTRRLP